MYPCSILWRQAGTLAKALADGGFQVLEVAYRESSLELLREMSRKALIGGQT